MQQVQFQHFYTYAELVRFLNEAAQAYPGYMRVASLAQTEEGREVFLVTLADFSLGDEAERRGAYWVQAGVHAGEGAGTTAALHLIEHLLSQPDVREILRRTVFYIVPRVNPDGTEHAITKGMSIRSKHIDQPGLPNAVIPADLNGDGLILSMRWPDPLGPMKEYDGMPGLMVPRQAGDQTGPFYSVCTEGLIENYDGGPIQPGQRSLDLNRSLPMNWNPSRNAADYPGRDIETRAILEFMATHPNIFAGIDFHCGSHCIMRPLMTPDTQLPADDRRTIVAVGQEGARMTGLPLIADHAYKDPADPPAPPHGCSNEWAYHALGISHYVIELGNGYNGIGLSTEEILQNLDQLNSGAWLARIVAHHREHGSEILLPWQPFHHPQLGPVEIGGLREGQGYYMLPEDIAGLIPRTSAFLLRHAAMGPQLALGHLEATPVGSGIYRIRARCMNQGRFGTTVMTGAKGHLAQQDVQVKIDAGGGAQVLSRPVQYRFRQIPSMGCELLEWFIAARPGDEITVEGFHPKTGSVIARIQLPAERGH